MMANSHPELHTLPRVSRNSDPEKVFRPYRWRAITHYPEQQRLNGVTPRKLNDDTANEQSASRFS